MPETSSTLEPVYSEAEREELGHMAYLIGRLDDLCERQLIAPAARATLAAENEDRRRQIERSGQYQAAIEMAKSLVAKQPRESLAWAARAQEIDPSRTEAWKLLIDVNWALGNDDDAMARCAQAAEHLPEFRTRIAELEEARTQRALARRLAAEHARQQAEVKERLVRIKSAVQEGRDDEVITLGKEILAIEPDHIDALITTAFAQQRSDRLDEALGSYETLQRLQPSQPRWAEWSRNVQRRREIKRLGGTASNSAPPGPAAQGPASARALFEPPTISWTSFAGAFLQAHAQELLLGLAVLLIVVSSTVGAHMLLGDLLWSPIGKCILALVATFLFAGFGMGLLSWGASRAGRMMLIATLIVVPIHFMLVGEMNLLHSPTTARYLFLVIEGVALVSMVRWVSAMLAPPAGARLLTAALLLISLGSVATARGSPTAWGVQFAAFQMSPLVFLAAVWTVGARRWGETSEIQRDFSYLTFGLLGFALVACLIRTGAYALRLDAALYALPVMLIGVSAIHAVRQLRADEPDAQRLAIMRPGGYGLSGLAFALSLAGPPAESAVHSGNIFAVACVGLVLYATALRRDRHPAFLYLAIGAIAVGRIGAHYVLAPRLHLVEEAVRTFLRYQDHLPISFRAILLTVPDLALAGLAIFFARSWRDRRLAIHCQYIALALAIAACAGSAFEPLAATICLSIYAILFLLGIWIFAAPLVTYLAATATIGACYFGLSLVPGVMLADHALAAALLGFTFWMARVQLRRQGASPAYHLPWLHAGLAMVVTALVAASAHLLQAGTGTLTGGAAFLIITMLAFALNRERPRAFWANLVLLSFVEFTICVLGLATPRHGDSAYRYGLLFVFDSLLILAVGETLRAWITRLRLTTPADRTGASTEPLWIDTIFQAVPRAAIILVSLGGGMACFDISRTWGAGLVFLFGSAATLWLTRMVRRQPLVYFAVIQLVVSILDFSSCAVGWNDAPRVAGWLAVTAALTAMSLWAGGTASRRFKVPEFFTRPCFDVAFGLSVAAYVIALEARILGREAYTLAALALGLNVVVSMALARSWHKPELTYAAVFHFVSAIYLVLFSVGDNDPAMAYVLGLAAAIVAIMLWSIGIVCGRSRSSWTAACAGPLCHWAVFLTVVAVVLADRSSLVLALVALSFLMAVKGLSGAGWLYGFISALLAAAYVRWLDQVPHTDLIGYAMAAAGTSWASGVAIERYGKRIRDRLGLPVRAYEFPFFHTTVLLAVVAIVLRIESSLNHVTAWNAQWPFPLEVAALCILMLRAYPHRALVHLGLTFLTFGIISAIVPSISSACFFGLAGIMLALILLLLERVLQPHEPVICMRLGVRPDAYSSVVRSWALVLFGLTLGLSILIVGSAMSGALLGWLWEFTHADWWVMLAVLGLSATFVLLLGSEAEDAEFIEPESRVMVLHWLAVAAIWWLGIASSPIAGEWVQPSVYYPLATALAALGTVGATHRYGIDRSWLEISLLGDIRSRSIVLSLSAQALILAALAVLFTGGNITTTTSLTLVSDAVTLGLVALTAGWPRVGLAAGMAWSAAWGVGGAVVVNQSGSHVGGSAAIVGSIGVLLSAFSLVALAARIRDRSTQPARSNAPDQSVDESWFFQALAVALEVAALVSSFVVVGTILINSTGDTRALSGWGTAVGVALILGAAALQVLIVPRWQSEWLVYSAQGMILLAYGDYRLAFPHPIAFDAILLTLLGYLDLGLAETLARMKAPIFARPARFFSLVLPGLPLLQLVWSRGLDDVSLFYLLAAATFYGIACGQFRWKSLGYAAAVFFNAALWLLWSRLGWRMTTHPQFFLVPVGLSTILFAEVNRRELGRSNVNTIRIVGLTIIYSSLALPIWRDASFGAWTALLIGSLAGIFVGIGLRLQTFLWMGLTTFVLDVIYEMGRVSLDYAFAKWAIMLALGIALVMFVALNEKKQMAMTMRGYFDRARLWE